METSHLASDLSHPVTTMIDPMVPTPSSSTTLNEKSTAVKRKPSLELPQVERSRNTSKQQSPTRSPIRTSRRKDPPSPNPSRTPIRNHTSTLTAILSPQKYSCKHHDYASFPYCISCKQNQTAECRFVHFRAFLEGLPSSGASTNVTAYFLDWSHINSSSLLRPLRGGPARKDFYWTEEELEERETVKSWIWEELWNILKEEVDFLTNGNSGDCVLTHDLPQKETTSHTPPARFCPHPWFHIISWV